MTGGADLGEWAFPNRATPLGSAAYYAIRFSPQAQHQRQACLLAWFELVGGIASQARDPGVARLKLDWWRQEVEAMAHGRARHPLALALQQTGGSLDPRALREIIDGAETEIVEPRVGDIQAFRQACTRGWGMLCRLLAGPGDLDDELSARCVLTGAYYDAVERVRLMLQAPQRLPPEFGPGALRDLPAGQRGERLDALLSTFAADASAAELPGVVARLLALGRASHQKMSNKGYPLANPPVDRLPIAKLWTAWRQR